ncbi:hypothetical protein J4377_09720 [Halomonas sp. XH26]|uniref:TrlF family AAA-like ATPase n=1 Tax=Halomonas sp. XH26 TaxID=2557993 RepID=UPI00209E2348|nr:hypothetical protein [Halomonas sp. XH26]UTA78266.1 hypothetical protein J4377_09720 [Halomonas sp. XH26]
MKRYEHGSEWRRWDLHVHTPDSILDNRFKNEWDDYIEALEEKGSEVAVLGATDYFTISGYKKIIDYKAAGRLENIEAIFPNIEFRVSPETEKDKGINIHLIISPNDEDHIERIDAALARFTIDYDDQTYACTEQGLMSYGKAIDPSLSPEAALKTGALQFKPSFDSFKKWLKEDSWLRRNSVVVVANSSKDGASGIRENGFQELRKDIYYFTDFIFSARPKDIAHFMGSENRSVEDVIQDYRKIIPCIHGSDAHVKDKIFKPDLDRFCWIKADPCFDGLKQVLFEPERVKIQELKPEGKPPYQIIRRVRYVDKSGKHLFGRDWINFNEDLNTVIGGKSSGKSMLLYHIAKAINPEEVRHNITTSNSSSYDDLKSVGFEVEWGNGELSIIGDGEDFNQENEVSFKAITYIPQLYINKLADKDGKEDLNELVASVLMQNKKHKKLVDENKNEITLLKKEISNGIDNRFELREKLTFINKEIAEIGSEEAIIEEISRLEKTSEKLREKSKFKPSESSLYEKLTRRKKRLFKARDKFWDIGKGLINIAKTVETDRLTWLENISSDLRSKSGFVGNSTVLKYLNDDLVKNLSSSFDVYREAVELKSAKAFSLISELDGKISGVEKSLNPLEEMVNGLSELKRLNSQIENERNKLKLIKEKSRYRNEIVSNGLKCREEIKEKFHVMVRCYIDICEDVANQNLDQDISVEANLSINSHRFNDFIDCFNRKGNLSFLLNGLVDENGDFILTDIANIDEIFNAIANRISDPKSPTLRKHSTEKDAFKRLFEDYFEINYIVTYKNDNVVQMSPGKRGLVLLNLMLELSNSTHPILIDQPEDNLDNRTIYSELKDFVKRCKSKRQIIMVTHNANLVVSADAECVIVADQRGHEEDLIGDRYRFEYVGGSLELSYSKIGDESYNYLSDMGIRQHVCHILEGGVKAFKEREKKYNLVQESLVKKLQKS